MDVKNLYYIGAPIYDWAANYYRNKLYPEAIAAYDQALREHLPNITTRLRITTRL